MTGNQLRQLLHPANLGLNSNSGARIESTRALFSNAIRSSGYIRMSVLNKVLFRKDR